MPNACGVAAALLLKTCAREQERNSAKAAALFPSVGGDNAPPHGNAPLLVGVGKSADQEINLGEYCQTHGAHTNYSQSCARTRTRGLLSRQNPNGLTARPHAGDAQKSISGSSVRCLVARINKLCCCA